MEYITRVVRSQPLTIHFCLHNPAATNEPVFVPRTLGPLGVFTTLAVRDAGGATVYEGPTVRATLRLDPKSPASYQPLEAGYTFGVMLETDELSVPSGTYELTLRYSNSPFTGTPSTPVGKLEHQATLTLEIADSASD
jgi:hypothetical protein